jgi:hypothetical protein
LKYDVAKDFYMIINFKHQYVPKYIQYRRFEPKPFFNKFRQNNNNFNKNEKPRQNFRSNNNFRGGCNRTRRDRERQFSEDR